VIISRWLLLRMKNASDKCREVQNTHCMFKNFFPPENHAVYEIVWRNMVKSDRPQMTIWRMRIPCWIPEATNTHTQNVQYLSLFHRNDGYANTPQFCVYTYIGCHVYFWRVLWLKNKFSPHKLLNVDENSDGSYSNKIEQDSW